MNKFFTLVRETGAGRFLILFGIVNIVMAIFMFYGSNNTKNFIKTEAVVSKVELYEEEHYDEENHYDATYTVYVKYTVDGKEYDQEYGIFPNYKVGDKVTISYNPSDPTDIAQPIGIMWSIVFGILGVGCICGGVYSLIKAFKRHQKMKKQEEEWAHGN